MNFYSLTILLSLCAVLTLTGCSDSGNTANDAKAHAARRQYDEARTARDFDRALLIADSMEQTKLVSSPQADWMRAYVYDAAWQMRLAEMYYKKSYEALSSAPAKNWSLYADAGYRCAFLMGQRGDVEGSLGIISTILDKAEKNSDFPIEQKASLLCLMANCQQQLKQLDAAKHTYLKVYEMLQEASKKEDFDSFHLMVICCNTFQFFMTTGDYEEATLWLARIEETLQLMEHKRNSALVEEYRGHFALYRALLLQAKGHAAEAAAVYDAIPASRIINPLAFDEAARYLMAASRYSEAADMYARLDTTFVCADSARKSFDIIQERIAPHYIALRKAGRDTEALVFADSISSAIDSALVWQKKNDASELAIIYQSHEKELALEESQFIATIYRILAVAAILVCLILLYFFWRVARYNRVLRSKNRRLLANMVKREQEEQQAIEQLKEEPEESLSPNQQLFRRLCILMTEQQPYADENLNRDMLAQMLGTNAKYVTQAIRECSHGETPGDFITRYRLEHVARLLKNTDQPIALIGEMAGIPSRATLARLFRNTYGMTCTEYRQTTYEKS